MIIVTIEVEREAKEAECLVALLTKKLTVTPELPGVLKEDERLYKHGETTFFYYESEGQMRKSMLVGLDKGTAALSNEELRCCGGKLAHALKTQQVTQAICPLQAISSVNQLKEDAFQSFFEGVLLGYYEYNRYKTKYKSLPETTLVMTVLPSDLSMVKTALERAGVIADSVKWARDLANVPGNDLLPLQMGAEALKRFKNGVVEVELLKEDDLKREKMGGVLAVGQGSKNPSCMIVLRYRGNPVTSEVLALVGKGVTFDSGGLSLKPGENMGAMKGDMAGGAVVLGAIEAIARLELKCNVVALIPCAENMPSGNAFRPGDIVTAMDGTTIEIINTDAEGRLLLADAISYAQRLGATRIIDIATLTGACMVALGKVAAGVVGNEPAWAERLMRAAETSGEKMWQFPCYEEYGEMIKSPIADLKNTGGRWGGAITAGMFLKHFAKEVPWVHIDIAGLEMSDKQSAYCVKGATGFGTRTLIQLVKDMECSC